MQSQKRGLADYLRSFPHPGGIVVCENPRFIYMKSTKTAGSSILREGFEKTSLDIFHHRDHPARFNAWLAQVDDAALEDYFVFSIVRNPWDRLVSIASYFGIPFDEYVQNYRQHIEVPDTYVHSLPLHTYTHLEDGTVFADFIGRMENLQSDFNDICDQLHLARIELPHTNRSLHSHYSMYFDEAAFELMNSIYAKDIEYYGYQFEQRAATIGERFIKSLGRSKRAKRVFKRLQRIFSSF